jgi:hypothetical protein
MYTRRYKNQNKNKKRSSINSHYNKKTRKIKCKKGGGWVSDLYLLKAIKRNFFPSQKDKERNLFFYKDSTKASDSA